MTSFKPFFQHIVKHGEQRHRTIKLSSPQPRPRVLTAAEAQTILDACDHLRDRLLFALLLDAGMRIGEALGLRHEDLDIAGCQVAVVSRVNDNRARVKGGRPRFIPTSGELIRLYADYLNVEYGALDSDYVFVNLWGRPHGHPLSYPAVYDLVGRLRRRTGVDFSPHWFRHTYATWLLRRGGGDGKRQGAARPCLDRHHRRHLRPPHRRGCPRDVGGRRLVHRNRGPVVNRTSTSAEPGEARGLVCWRS